MLRSRIAVLVFTIVLLLVGVTATNAENGFLSIADAQFDGCTLKVWIEFYFGGHYEMRVVGGDIDFTADLDVSEGAMSFDIPLESDPTDAPLYVLLSIPDFEGSEVSLDGVAVWDVPDCDGDETDDGGSDGDDDGGSGGNGAGSADDHVIEETWFDSGDNRINRQPYATFAVVCKPQRILIYSIDAASGEGALAIAVDTADIGAAPAQDTVLASGAGIQLIHLASGDLLAVGAAGADGKVYAFQWNGCPVSEAQAYVWENGVVTVTEHDAF